MKLDDPRRLRLLSWTFVGLAGSTILVSLPLWLTTTEAPVVPLIAGLPQVPQPLDKVVVGSLFLCLLLVALEKFSTYAARAFVVLSSILVVTDLTRLEPEIETFILLAGILGIGARARAPDPAVIRTKLELARVVVVLLYLAAGYQKLGYTYIYVTGPSFAAQLFPASVAFEMSLAGLGLELAIPFLLIVKKTRLLGILSIVGLHVVILATVGPFGTNTEPIIWPWNVAMPVMTVALFWKHRAPWSPVIFRHVAMVPIVLLLGVLPVLGFLEVHDDAYAALNMYTGQYPAFQVELTPGMATRLPAGIREDIRPGREGRLLLGMGWYLERRTLWVHPSKRAHLEYHRFLCEFAGDDDDVILHYWAAPDRWTGKRPPKVVYRCRGESG